MNNVLRHRLGFPLYPGRVARGCLIAFLGVGTIGAIAAGLSFCIMSLLNLPLSPEWAFLVVYATGCACGLFAAILGWEIAKLD